VVSAVLDACLPPVLWTVAGSLTVAAVLWAAGPRRWAAVLRRVFALCSVLALCLSLWQADRALDLRGYLQSYFNRSTIYEQHYVDPRSVTITAPAEKKNLLWIYLESMETTYSSPAEGGKQAHNYIPNLTALARENLSFSNTDNLGGFHADARTGWTMAAMFATSAGIPFSFPVSANSMYQHTTFAPNVTALGDILEEQGYRNVFCCGSDAEFGGRSNYLSQHGNYAFMDLFAAREAGYVDPDYYVWWGFEDQILYEIAKQELTKLAAGEQPFNFTMLTVDTHHIDGYVCPLCEDTYPQITANVVACADRQVQQFLDWCEEQPFYEDTLIVVTGDHARMDTALVEGLDMYERPIYNCFIHAEKSAEGRDTFRDFASVDLFPTVLSAMGYDIEGDRLGLGTDLFSQRTTLLEEMGWPEFNRQMGAYSEFFMEHLA